MRLLTGGVKASNETKLSDGVIAERVAVRCIVWLDPSAHLTK